VIGKFVLEELSAGLLHVVKRFASEERSKPIEDD
jgi:hypothetical protein